MTSSAALRLQHPNRVLSVLQLEAFRAQKAAAKALKAAPTTQPAPSLQQENHPVSAGFTASLANTSQSLLRAASLLPLSTHAQPITYGGSDEEASENRKPLLRPVPIDKATPVPTYPVASASQLPMRIPFTGRDSTDSSSTQQPTPQSAGAAAAASSSSSANQGVPVKYQSRLPPPPPVFKPPSRSQAGVVQSSEVASTFEPVHAFTSPHVTPAAPTKDTSAISPTRPDQSGQVPIDAPVQTFHSGGAGPSGSRGSPQQAVPRFSTAARPTASQLQASPLSGPAQSVIKPTAPAAAAADVSLEAAEAAARLSHDAEASHLTLVSERQVLPEVATGRSMDFISTSAALGEVPDVSQPSGEVSPVKDQVLQDVQPSATCCCRTDLLCAMYLVSTLLRLQNYEMA